MGKDLSLQCSVYRNARDAKEKKIDGTTLHRNGKKFAFNFKSTYLHFTSKRQLARGDERIGKPQEA